MSGLVNPLWISDATLTALEVLAGAGEPITRTRMVDEIGVGGAAVQVQINRLITLGWAESVPGEPVRYRLTERGRTEHRSLDGGA